MAKKTTRKATKRKSPAKKATARKTAAKKTTRKTTKKTVAKGKTASKKPAAATKSMSAAPVITVSRVTRFDSYALAYALAILGALWVLVLSILGNLGFYAKKVQLMQMAIPYYSLSVSGIVIGAATVAIYGLIAGLVIGWLYNKFS